MIEVDDTLRAELNRLVVIDPRSDWNEIVARAGLKRERRRRRWLACAAVAAAATVLGIATPLGSPVVRGIDDFSAWLAGEPGSPVSEKEQREFEAANARSWLGFPQGTELRRLITSKAGETTIDLLGFRSGSSALCLRLTVTGKSRTSTLSCAPLAELRREGGPARVVLADHPVGKGSKVAWYGIDRLHSANLQITAGIVTDAVTSVVLEDDAGRHKVRAKSNAFLYVAERPEVGQRVKRVWARTSAGLVPVPFARAPFGFGGVASRAPAPLAPPIERRVTGGRVGWLDDHEPRGEPLDVLPPHTLRNVLGHAGRPGRPTNVLYGRVLTPDPDRPLRVAVTLSAHRPGGPPAGLCTWLVTGGGAAGGCAPYPGVFKRSPMPGGLTGGGSGAFVTVSGVASDDVARLEVLLVDQQQAAVTLVDNAFLVDVPRAKLPVRLVAYDEADRVIAVSDPWFDFGGGSSPAKGRARSLLRVTGAGGATAELFVGPSTDGGECMYIRHSIHPRHAGTMVGCKRPNWTGPPLQLSSQLQPPRFVGGRVRADVKAVRIRFADGTSATLAPTRGYVLWVASKQQLLSETAAILVEGLDGKGNVLGRISLKPPTR